jgi:hypothetical protein
VAGVETHPYSPFFGPTDHFWQSYEENQVQKIFCRDLPYDFEKSEIDICTRIFDFAKRTVGLVGFRPLPIGSQLKNAQFSSKAPSSTKSWRSSVWRRAVPEISYCTLGRPC